MDSFSIRCDEGVAHQSQEFGEMMLLSKRKVENFAKDKFFSKKYACINSSYWENHTECP